MSQLLARAQGVDRALERREADLALTQARQLEAEAMRLGLRSSHLRRCVAIALDLLGQVDKALDAILEAYAMDPLDPGVRQSLTIIGRGVREGLLERSIDDGDIPVVIAKLERAGEATLETRVVLARHWLATGALERAEALVTALTVLAPGSLDAWALRLDIARAKGDAAQAPELQARLAVLEREYGHRRPRPQ